MVKHQYLKKNVRVEEMWKDETEIRESLESGVKKSNIREGHYIIITTKQPVMQEAKDIPRDNRT